MKMILPAVFCGPLILLHAAPGIWRPDTAGKTSISKENTGAVISGETAIVKEGDFTAFRFHVGTSPAVWKSEGILDSGTGSIELYFKPNIPAKITAMRSNYLFVSGPYSIGYNTSPKECAVYFLTKTTDGKPAGIYRKVDLKNGQWYKLNGSWTPEGMTLYLDDKFLASSGRGGSVFGKEFRIGSHGWGFSDCLIRDLKITRGRESAAPKKTEAVKPSVPAARNLPVAETVIVSSHPFPAPFCAVGKKNQVQNADFVIQEPLSASQKQMLAAKKFQVKSGQFPANWQVDTNWTQYPWSQGSFELRGMTKPDGKKGYYAVVEMPENKWNNLDFACLQKIPAERLKKEDFQAGFWGRGNGTVTVRIYESANGKRSGTTQEAFLLSSDWKFFRTNPLKLKNPASDSVSLAFSPYGRMELAMPEIALLPPVDNSAELTFYVPFDHGSPDALFSEGQTGAFGPGEPQTPVPGMAGGAYRVDRKRRVTGSGFLRYPMGLCYESMRNVLDRESGTVEFWFRPLPEMLKAQKWNPFYLMVIGQESYVWPQGGDFYCYLERTADGALELVVKESVKLKEWPTRNRLPNTGRQTVHRFRIPDPKQFVENWNHLAFTYDDNQRVIYWNGRPVITFPALKKPALMANDRIVFGTNHLTAPFLASCDFDEFRIYRGVRYHGSFTPSREALAFVPAAAAKKESVPVPEHAAFRVGKPELSPDAGQVIFPLTYGTESYRLALSLGDGYPLIFSSKDAAMLVKAKHHPAIPDLIPEQVKLGKDRVSGRIPRRDTEFVWSVAEKNGGLEVVLDLHKKDGFWTAYLEPRVSLKKPDAWVRNFDGFTTRNVLAPFRPFGFDSMMIGLPVSAAWSGNSGMLMGLSPDTIVSWLKRGMNHPDSIDLAIRTVLDKGDRMLYRFEVIPFDSKYGADSAVDAYHARHPEIFRRDPKVDPRVYGNIAITNTWNTPAFAERSKKFSIQEINRRARATWCWYYSSGTSTGNWEPDLEMLRELAPINVPQIANADYNANFHKRDGYLKIDRRGVAPAPYISAWTEKRFSRYFSDSVYDDRELPTGIDYIHSYWWTHITDFPVIQTGTSYGVWLRKQIRGIFRHYPNVSVFSHDELVGDYFFRKPNAMGGSRAFDENGTYTHNMAAMGAFVRDVCATPNASGFKTAVISNARIQSSGYNAMFRTSNNIYERPIHWAAQDWPALRQHTRIMGEKPNTFYPHHAIVGNYFHPAGEDVRMMRYFLTGYHHQQVLLGLLFNVKMNYNILGVKETVEALDELDRVQSFGYRQTAAVKSSPDLPAVRYGTPEYGVAGVVNASHLPKKTSFAVDCSYLRQTPFLAVKNSRLSVRNASVDSLAVAPLSWTLVELTGALPGTVGDLEYESQLVSDRNGRRLSFTFGKDIPLPSAVFGLAPDEELVGVTRNGRPVPHQVKGKRVVLDAVKMKKGDVLRLETRDSRWKSPASAIAEFPYLKDRSLEIVWTGASAQNEAERIAEYFRFWTLNQADGNGFRPAVSGKKTGAADRPRILVTEGVPAGISLDGGCVILKGVGRELANLTTEFLSLLDTKYPYAGFYGEQTPMLAWDYTSTREQRELNTKAGVIQKTLSTQSAAKEFEDWLKESRVNPEQGF